MTKMRMGVTIVTLLALGGCSLWTNVKQGDEALVAMEQLSTRVPAGWSYYISYTGKSTNELTVSKDGPAIQSVVVRWHAWDRKIHGDPEDRKIKRSQLALDMADQLVPVIQSRIGSDTFEVIDMAPAVFAGVPGFRIEWAYKTDRGLGFRGVTYGAGLDSGLAVADYSAPRIHYFERDLAVFERLALGIKAL